jgi:hypothetical protein
MNRKTPSTIAIPLALLIAAAAGQLAHAAVDPSCKVTVDAMMKQIGTPTHVVVSETGMEGKPGKPQTHEMIYLGDAIYLQMGGQWKRSPMTVQQMRQREEQNQRDTTSMSCHYLRDETVGGEAAAVYSVESTTPALGKSRATMWLSKRSGLPLKSENSLGVDDKSSPPINEVIRYDYTNVHAPAGVK